MNNSPSIKITNLILQKTGTYNTMYQRPYNTYIDQNTLNIIANRTDEVNLGKVSSQLFSDISGNILTPSATVENEVNITYGWGERRLRFVLENVCINIHGKEQIIYFQGYTSHDGVGANGSVDPNMIFYINSFIVINRIIERNAYGSTTRDVVTESANVINGNIVYDDNSNLFLMRPQDIFTGVQTAYLEGAYDYLNPNKGITDTRNRINFDSVKSHRGNGISSNFLARIVDSYQAGHTAMTFGQSEKDIFSECKAFVYESGLRENVFISAIMNIQGMQNVCNFSMQTLRSIDPNVDYVTNYINLSPNGLNELHSAGQTSYWNGSDRETVVATIISNGIPYVMFSLGMSKIQFTSSNMMTGSPYTVITNVVGIKSNINISLCDQFKLLLEKNILNDICYNNSDTYDLVASVDLFGETRLTISLNSGPYYDYTIPSFSDSLITPVVTSNKETHSTIIHDFEMLMNNIRAINPQQLYVNGAI